MLVLNVTDRYLVPISFLLMRVNMFNGDFLKTAGFGLIKLPVITGIVLEGLERFNINVVPIQSSSKEQLNCYKLVHAFDVLNYLVCTEPKCLE